MEGRGSRKFSKGRKEKVLVGEMNKKYKSVREGGAQGW